MRATTLDILYLTDLRFPGGSSTSLIEEVHAARSAGFRVGALHCRSTSLRADRTFHGGIRELIDSGDLLLIRPGEPVECSLTVVKHPTVMVESMGGRLPVKSGSVAVFVGQVPVDADGTTYYDPATVHAHVVEALSGEPVWHPVSPTVRERLLGGGVPLASEDWVEVIDSSGWAVERNGPRGDVPIIGRHGRPSVAKWPDDPADLMAAYPVDGSADVHVLGWVAGLESAFSSVPDAWTVHEFGAVEPREFLAGLDFFVYYHHPDLVEAFGRTIIEAMSAGCVVVLPPHFEPLFGEGCLYARPRDAFPLVRSLHQDRAAFRSRSERGVEEVVARFSHGAHVRRLQEFVGDPARATGRAAPMAKVPEGFAQQRPAVLVCCIGVGPDRAAEVVRTTIEQRDRTTGIEPSVVCDSPAPLVAQALGEELVIDPDRRCFVGSESGIVFDELPSRQAFNGPGSWEDHVLLRIGAIRRRRRVAGVVVADPDHPDSWLALQGTH